MPSKEHPPVRAEPSRALTPRPDADPETAVAELRARLAQGSTDALSVARALGEIAHPAAARALAEMETSAQGAFRREVRRALFRMRQRGIEVPLAPPTGEAKAPAPAEEAGFEALLSPYDSAGMRLAWIFKGRPQGGIARLWGLVSQDEGLKAAGAGNLSRRELRTESAAVEARSGFKLFSADWRLVDVILCEAYRTAVSRPGHRVGHFLMLRAELIGTRPPGAEFVHPIYAELGSAVEHEPSLSLLKEPEMAAWTLPPQALQPYLDELDEARQSVIVVSPARQQERLEAVIERAVAELFSGSGGERARRRLEDTAYYLARCGRREAAGWAGAAARQLRDGVPPARIAILREMVRVWLSAALETRREEASGEPRLIVTPAEAMRAAAERQRPQR